jgi:hypothetical protein
MAKAKRRNEFDHAWKEVLDLYFERFLAFFFPDVHAAIDWTRGYVSLDKELRKIQRDAAFGKREADKLVKVWLLDGHAMWVQIHIEVQNQEEADFERRVFVYNYRIFDRYNQKVASLVILGDERPNWRPNHFGYELFGCSMGIRFPIIKLLDFRNRWAELEASDNPFATVVMAHLKSLETTQDPKDRRSWKFQLVRALYEKGMDADAIRNLFQFIDWVMMLPQGLEDRFQSDVLELEEEKGMPFITSVERSGIRKGLQKGIESVLRARFGKADRKIMAGIRKIYDIDLLERIMVAAEAVEKASDLQQLMQPK